jgi:hypothetical protein
MVSPWRKPQPLRAPDPEYFQTVSRGCDRLHKIVYREHNTRSPLKGSLQSGLPHTWQRRAATANRWHLLNICGGVALLERSIRNYQIGEGSREPLTANGTASGQFDLTKRTGVCQSQQLGKKEWKLFPIFRICWVAFSSDTAG